MFVFWCLCLGSSCKIGCCCCCFALLQTSFHPCNEHSFFTRRKSTRLHSHRNGLLLFCVHVIYASCLCLIFILNFILMDKFMFNLHYTGIPVSCTPAFWGTRYSNTSCLLVYSPVSWYSSVLVLQYTGARGTVVPAVLQITHITYICYTYTVYWWSSILVLPYFGLRGTAVVVPAVLQIAHNLLILHL